MKKISAFFIISIFLINLLSQIGIASAAANTTTNQTKETYLQSAWIDLLNKTQIGSVLIALNPIFKITLGMQFEVTLLFLFSLIAWIVSIVLIFSAVKNIFQTNSLISFAIAIIVSSIGSTFKIIPKIVTLFLPLVQNPWLAFAAIGLVVIILVIYEKFMNKYGEGLKERKKKEDEARREEKARNLERLQDIKLEEYRAK